MFKFKSVYPQSGPGLVFFFVASVLLGCGGQADMSIADQVEEGETESPLREFLGLDQSGLFATDEFERTARLAIEDYVVSCMAEQGFEWRAEAVVARSGADASGLRADSREWVETYGFGVSTSVPGQSQGAGQPVGGDKQNSEYLASLTDVEIEAYNRALWGNSGDMTLGANGPQTGGGCFAAAEREAVNMGGLQVLEAMAPEIADLESRVLADSRVAVIERELEACVEATGLSYVRPTEAPDYFAGLVLINLGPDQEESVAGGEGLSETKYEALAAIQQEEISLALAIYDCSYEVGYNKMLREVGIEYERDFVREHGNRISALLDG